MKKLIIAGFIGLGIILTASQVQAVCSDYACPATSGLTSKTSRFFSNATGQNFIAERIAQHLMKKAIKKSVDGDFKVNIDSYSVRDLKAGKFKSIDVKGKNVSLEGVYISELEFKTLCDYNYITYDKKDGITIMQDVPIGISIAIKEDDLNKTMMSKDYKRLLNDLNSFGGSFNIFQIDSTCIKIKNNKIYYVMKIAIPFIRGTQDVVMTADLKVKDGDIKFANVQLLNNRSNMDISRISNILNYINPLDFSVKILENKEANFNVRNVSIEDGKIQMDANMVILKDVENQI